MAQLFFTIGLARAGKSSFAKRWKSEGNNRVVLEQDNFRAGTYGVRFRLEGEELARGSFIVAIRALLLGGYDVLAVDTHTGYWNVNQMLMIDPKAQATIFHTPLEVCKERALADNMPDLLPSLDRMNKNLSITLPMISREEIKLNYEEIGPNFRWIKNGYWNT